MTDGPMPASRTGGASLPDSSARKQAFYLALDAVPEGRVTSYGALARMAGMGRGARQVGRWLSDLPNGTDLPWHRVVNSQGRLAMPPGSAPDIEQQRRLQEEGVVILDRRIDLRRFGWPD
jgi:methylated-DNA-protein-cysteine methyltransferase related protein